MAYLQPKCLTLRYWAERFVLDYSHHNFLCWKSGRHWVWRTFHHVSWLPVNLRIGWTQVEEKETLCDSYFKKASVYRTGWIYFMTLIPNAPHCMISLHICDSNQPVLMNSALLLYLWPAGLEIWFGTQSVGNTKPSIFSTRGCFD